MTGYGHADGIVGAVRRVERLCSACGAPYPAPLSRMDHQVFCPDCIVERSRGARLVATRDVERAAYNEHPVPGGDQRGKWNR